FSSPGAPLTALPVYAALVLANNVSQTIQLLWLRHGRPQGQLVHADVGILLHPAPNRFWGGQQALDHALRPRPLEPIVVTQEGRPAVRAVGTKGVGAPHDQSWLARPALRRTTGANPPIRSGGPPSCTGLGPMGPTSSATG